MQEMKTENENTQAQTTDRTMGSTSILWALLNSLSFCGSLVIGIDMVSGWVFDNYNIKHNVLNAMSSPLLVLFIVYTQFKHHWCRGIPYGLVGGKRRALIDSLILGSAIILRIYYPFDGNDYRKICLLVFITLQLHSWGKSLHLSWDIYIGDVVMHTLVLFGIYLSRYWICIFLTFIVSVVILVRCVEYKAPITPEDIKKERRDNI